MTISCDNVRRPVIDDGAVTQARQFSRYLDRILHAQPDLLTGMDINAPARVSEMLARLALDATIPRGEIERSLRRLRRQTMAVLIVRDLSGSATLSEVVTTMTQLAEGVIATTLDWLENHLAPQMGEPIGASSSARQQLHVVGMGKLGGKELNVSSDIDLVYAYPEEGETRGGRGITNQEYFTRLARMLGSMLSEITGDGYVFRVDTRLRPYGDSGPLVVSFDMLENYLVAQGREWERYAWIKARVLTGNCSTELMELVRPFVFRRHLDFSAFSSMRELHEQIRREVERRDIAENIKLGRGGIREIEFIAQVFQLIRGGRDAALRRQPTLEVLGLLTERNLLPAAIAHELNEAYLFLRNLEHRLQYLDDQQTHTLPANDEDLSRIAQSMGSADTQSFLTLLAGYRNRVAQHFDEIFTPVPQQQHPLAAIWCDGLDTAPNVQALADIGFVQPEELIAKLARMRASARYREMPATSQSRLDRLIPLTIESAAAQRTPNATLERMLAFLEAVSRRESYLALLEEYPQARARLTGLMAASPWIADYLTQHPILLDELLDARSLHENPDWKGLADKLHTTLEDVTGDTEKQMDILRHFKHQQTLRLIAQDLEGMLSVETLSDHLSDLANIVLAETLRLAWLNVKQRHREKPAFAIIGYGKLGGKEMGYASDLDLVFLYEDAAPDAAENYARLTQRLVTWLTSTTSAGVLYDTDLRLRPDGASGLLTSPLASFRTYQEKHAWMWEHQALTRARFVTGDSDIGNIFEEIRISVLRKPRDIEELRTEVAAMRRKMLDAHPNTSALFDIKHDHGGIIDVEFAVQFLVLGHSHRHATLTANIGNLALLKLAAELGLLPQDVASGAQEAYRALRKLQHELRLQGERYARVPVARVETLTAAITELWNLLFPKLK